MYLYQAKILHWVDGDTVDCEVDLGFHTFIKTRFRLLGINTPERYTELGKTVKQYVEQTFPVGTSVSLKSSRTGKFGRWLGELFINNQSINQHLLDKGYADIYSG